MRIDTMLPMVWYHTVPVPYHTIDSIHIILCLLWTQSGPLRTLWKDSGSQPHRSVENKARQKILSSL